MTSRIARETSYQLQPALLSGLYSLDKAASQRLPPLLVHLVKLRVSQLNGCAFCLQMHSTEARKDGEQQQRLDLLSAWAEAPELFSAAEQAALHWAEKLTLLASQRPTDTDYQRVSSQFSDKQLVDLTALIMSINAWNRLAVGLHFQPGR